MRPLAVFILIWTAGLMSPGTAAALPLTFSGPTHLATDAAPRSVAVADFNADGDPDLAIATEVTDKVSVLLGEDGMDFSGATKLDVGDGPRAVAAGIFNGGGDPDLAVANFNADTVSILLGGAGGTFGPKTDFNAGNGPRAIAVGLFGALGDRDLAVTNEHSDDVSVLVGAPGGSFTGPTNHAAGGSPSGVAAAHFNGDAYLDLAVSNLATDDVSILLGSANAASFGTATDIAAGDGPRAVATGDFNGDGDVDLAVPNENSDDVSILVGGAGASFAPALSYAVGNGPRAVATGDFNRDGDLDLAFANSESDDVAVLLGGLGASFSTPTTIPAGIRPTAIATGDFDRDGEQDLIAANEISDGVSIYRNTTAPDTTIDSGPSGLTANAAPTFTFSADEPGATFTCALDGPFVACTSPFTAPAQPDGDHTFRVRASDPAGNVDATPARHSFTVDATPPDTRIDAGPPGLSRNPAPTFAFSSSEPGAAFECRVDAAAFAACPAPLTVAALPDGAHGFEVRAVDPAGNADPTPASYAFVIDTTPPETTIRSGPSGQVADLNPTFAFSASEAGASFQCRVDQEPFAACSPPITTRRLKPGPHSFEVRATDAAGNVDASPARRSFTALLEITLSAPWDYERDGPFTILMRLVVRKIPRGARVEVRCRGGGCPFARRTLRRNRRGSASATKLFRGRRLRPGTVVEVRVTARYAIGAVRRLRMRSGSRPQSTTLCLPPGSTRPRRRC